MKFESIKNLKFDNFLRSFQKKELNMNLELYENVKCNLTFNKSKFKKKGNVIFISLN